MIKRILILLLMLSVLAGNGGCDASGPTGTTETSGASDPSGVSDPSGMNTASGGWGINDYFKKLAGYLSVANLRFFGCMWNADSAYRECIEGSNLGTFLGGACGTNYEKAERLCEIEYAYNVEQSIP